MLSLIGYKLIHLIGVFLFLIAMGASILHGLNGGTKHTNRFRAGVGMAHGLGLFCILLGGFGMAAKMGITWPMPIWMIVKVLLWVIAGGLLALSVRRPYAGRLHWLITILTAFSAAYVGLTKPF